MPSPQATVLVNKSGATPIIVGLLPTTGTGRSTTATVLSVSRYSICTCTFTCTVHVHVHVHCMHRGLARDVIGHVIHRKLPSLGASGSSFVRDLVEYTLCFKLRQEFWKGQDR